MAEEFSWKGIIIIIILVLVFGLVIWLFIYMEKSWKNKDSLYEELCPKAGLKLYKSSEDIPHWEKCYDIDEKGIIQFYYLHKFEGVYYLRTGLN